MRNLLTHASMAFALCWAACDSPTEPTTTTIGPSGGSVEADGASAQIPSGALSSEVEIGVGPVTGLTATLPAGLELAGTPYAFTPHGTSFDAAITIEVPHDGSGTLAVRLDDESDGTWERIDPASVGATTVTIETNRFSVYAAARPVGLDSGVPDDGGGSVDAGAGDDGGGGTDGGAGSAVVFPPRDFVCAGGSPPCETTTPARSEAERTVTVSVDMAPTTFTYLISNLSVGTDGTLDPVAGFNQDGLHSGSGSTEPSATCEELNIDTGSLFDSLHVGVDNAMATIVPTIESLMDSSDCPGGTTAGCVDFRIQSVINDGSNLLLVEVQEVESFVNDPAVTVVVYLGTGTPTLSGELPAPGQTFGTAMELARGSGDIFEGRLRVTFPELRILPPISASNPWFLTTVQQVELRADIDASGLTNGQLSGNNTVDFVTAQAEMLLPDIASTATAVASSIADLEPSAGDVATCDRLSMGATLRGVPATRTP